MAHARVPSLGYPHMETSQSPNLLNTANAVLVKFSCLPYGLPPQTFVTDPVVRAAYGVDQSVFDLVDDLFPGQTTLADAFVLLRAGIQKGEFFCWEVELSSHPVIDGAPTLAIHKEAVLKEHSLILELFPDYSTGLIVPNIKTGTNSQVRGHTSLDQQGI